MYAQLGTIRFEGLKGFASLEQTFGVNYAQHDRINNKPRLEAVGDNLDAITFDMYLHSTFTDPEADIEQLRTAMRNREVLRLVLGNGRVLGNFVIPSFTISTSFTDGKGNIIEATISVELLEAFSESPLQDAQRQAIATAFATSARSSNVRSVLPLKVSPAMAVTANVGQIQADGKIINQYAAAATANANTYEYYTGKVDSALDRILNASQAVSAQINSAVNLYNLATSLPTALDDINTRIQNIKATFPITDIGSFLTLNAQLQNSIYAAKAASIGINNQSIIRRL
jgi:phage protein U